MQSWTFYSRVYGEAKLVGGEKMIEGGLTFEQSVWRIFIYAVFLFIVIPFVVIPLINFYKNKK